ncbi:putative ubiquitin-conjugating enzyme E2 38 [Drosera capensis]
MEIDDSPAVIDDKLMQNQGSLSESDLVEDDDDDGMYDPEDYEDGGDDFLGDGGDDFIVDDDDGKDDDVVCDDGDYLKLQARFDNVDLPPGVEASVSWMVDAAPSEVKSHSVASTSKASSDVKKEEEMDDVLRKLMYFKQFDIVEDFSDHHFAGASDRRGQGSKNWAKKIHDEWRVLEQNLPENIYVRVYEGRMDLLRAAIIGPAGTPYHDGLFFFDAIFPPAYPSVPPSVYYFSGGLRLNPNLYECGKVCLSLLGTWSGQSTEKWLPDKSTMLQVLVSIQALILNEKPFFNEPGYEASFRGNEGQMKSRQYNEEAFLLSVKTMMYTLRRPPKHFEDLVAGHFQIRAHDILSACSAYSQGALVGCDTKMSMSDGNQGNSSGSAGFKDKVKGITKKIAAALIENGAKDCEKFQA